MTPLRILLLALLGLDALVLFLKISDLSISFNEAKIFFGPESFLTSYITYFTTLFGQNDYTLRMPMIALHVGSVLLFYAITAPFAKYERDRIWVTVVFMMLPGVTSAALLFDAAGIVLFFLMFYLFLQQRIKKASYPFLGLLIFVDSSFSLLFLAQILYGYDTRRYRFMAYNTVLLMASAGLYGFDFGGVPKSSFVDTLGIYATIFSPIIFFYLFYVLYRRFLTQKRDLLFYIASTAFLVSLLLSFRQRIGVETFAPYMMAALPLAMQSFFHAYRVRLKVHRKLYIRLFIFAFVLLILNEVIVFFHKEIYRFLPDPDQLFAHRLHVASELATQLHEHHIECIDAQSDAMQLRLQYYGITTCKTYRLVSEKREESDLNVTILYKKIPIYKAYVTNIHIK